MTRALLINLSAALRKFYGALDQIMMEKVERVNRGEILKPKEMKELRQWWQAQIEKFAQEQGVTTEEIERRFEAGEAEMVIHLTVDGSLTSKNV